MEGISEPIEDRHTAPHVFPQELSRDDRAIHYGVLAAEANEREIDDGTARRIASQLHGGQASALYSLASSGTIDEERLYREIGRAFEEQSGPDVREWLNWLGAYCVRRSGRCVHWPSSAQRPRRSGGADRRRPKSRAGTRPISLPASFRPDIEWRLAQPEQAPVSR